MCLTSPDILQLVEEIRILYIVELFIYLNYFQLNAAAMCLKKRDYLRSVAPCLHLNKHAEKTRNVNRPL